MGMNTTPQLWNQTTEKYDQRLAGTNDAAHTLDQSLSATIGILGADGLPKTTLSDILPVWYHKVPAVADYTTIVGGDVTALDFTLSSHAGKVTDATALVISCSGGASFRGVLVAINKATTTAAAAAFTTATAPNSANAAHHLGCFFCPPGFTLIPFNEVIGQVHLLAIDSTTEDNVVQVSPL